MQFRKKPVVIEATQFIPDRDRYEAVGQVFDDVPLWLTEAFGTEVVRLLPDLGNPFLRIGTLEDGPNGEAKHIASPGDWIIRGIAGELYPCKDGIFRDSYEPVQVGTQARITERLQARDELQPVGAAAISARGPYAE